VAAKSGQFTAGEMGKGQLLESGSTVNCEKDFVST